MKNFIYYLKTLFKNKKIESEWQLGYVTIGVRDLKQMKHFYTKALGLSILQSFDDFILLGQASGSIPMIKLVQTTQAMHHKGMYYLAFNLPKKEYLGDLANHLLAQKTIIQASEDDGGSEAFYILDPEKNKLKFYWDKPQQTVVGDFTHQEGRQKQLSLDYFLGISHEPYETLPRNSRLAQIHLSVPELEPNEEFFTQLLPFKTTYDYIMKRQDFKLNEDRYTIAINAWDKSFGDRQKPTDLLEFMIYAPSYRDLEAIVTKLEAEKITYRFNKGELTLTTPNQIQLCIKVRE